MADDIADLKAKRKKLDQRIAEAEGEQRLTPARVREMSDEEFREEAEARGLRPREPREDKVSQGSARVHLERGFAASDARAQREARQAGRGPRGGLEGSDDE